MEPGGAAPAAGDTGRRTEGWSLRPGQSANSLIQRSLPLIRERARDLARNNPWAASLVSEIVANLIHHGIIASFSEKDSGKKGSGKKGGGGRVPGIWLEWAESTQCDAMGEEDYYGLQRLIAATWIESGECFVRRVWREDWRPGEIPFALQVMEPEFIDHSHDGTDNTKLGIRFDARGRRLGYWVFKKHPGEAAVNESFFVDASEMIHLYSQNRPGQIRGVPFMTPVILRLYDLDSFEQSELKKQEIAAMFAGFRKKREGAFSPPVLDGALDGAGKKGGTVGDRIESGMIEILESDEDIVFANPPQRSGYGEYVKQNLMAIAAGVGLTYENLSGDYGRVTFLNGRMGQLRFFRKIDQWQYLTYIPKVCGGIGRWFVDGALIAGHDLSGLAIRWQPPTKQMVDPSREVPADERAVRAGFKTQYEVIRGNGNDPLAFLDEYREAQEAMDERGLVFSTDVRKVSGAGQAQGVGGDGSSGGEAPEKGDGDEKNDGDE